MKQQERKRTIIVILAAIALCIGLVGCRNRSQSSETSSGQTSSSQAGSDETSSGQTSSSQAGGNTEGERYVDIITDKLLIMEDVTYRTIGEEELKLDIYMPDEENAASRPAVILLHSGGMTKGDKKDDVLIQNLAEDLAKMGYVTFNVNYSLSGVEESYAYAVDKGSIDITAAFHWIEEHAAAYGVDKTRIAVAGYSAGASLAINTCYSDLQGYDIDTQAILGVIDMSGGNTFYGNNVRGDAPCLIIHGDADTTVPYEGSEVFQEILNDAGVENELYRLEGMNHTLTTKYDEIRNKIAMFLYQQLTGEKIVVDMKSEVSLEYQNVELRENNGVEYFVQQIDCVLDGKLDEWSGCQEIELSKLKDVGESLPEASDFSGTAYVGWNESTPGVIYIAVKITDDVIQNINDENGKWYNDDCLEIVFDLSMDGTAEQLIKWVIGAGAVDMSMLATAENTQVSTTTEQDTITYEIAIDLNKIDSDIREIKTPIVFEEGMKIGFSVAYNDCEEGIRQHQIGWTAGKSSDRTTLGNLIFK